MLLTDSFWAGFCAIVGFIAWRFRERVQVRRQMELRQAVQHRTEQLERGQAIEGSRNRILEMLVSNEPLPAVLDAIALAAREQAPGSVCIVLVKRLQDARHGNEFFVGAAPVIPANWLDAIRAPGAVPFEVWRQNCEYVGPHAEPGWRGFFEQLQDSIPAGSVPVTIRSVPIGEPASSLGAILLLYPEPPGSEPWERVLGVSARLAQIAIGHRRFCDQLDYQAHHDSLTGLPNRAMLNDRLENAIMEARGCGQRLAFLYIDVDEFKQINDRFSHRVGDALLVELGSRIGSVIRSGDTLARIGGDEFNVLLPDIGDVAGAMESAARILEAVRRPVSIGGQDVTVTLSIGIAMFPDDGEEARDLQRQADAAMYYAKSLGKNRAHSYAESTQVLDALRIEQDLREGLREGWFVVHYQPKFTASGRVAGMEALIRMNHPRQGQILPTQFIPIAESTGLIVPIGAWLISEVCRQIAEWRDRGLDDVSVAVNVSAVQIARLDFTETVAASLATWQLPPRCLELEVTERLAVNAESEEHRQMQRLRGMGIRISIDDFGTGFSSLSYLHQLQIDGVKLDRSFVQTIATDKGAQQVVRAVIAVARGLGLEVIAEGVETEAQRLELVAAGCSLMQGYLFALPGSPESVEPFLWRDREDAASGEDGRDGGDLARLYDSIDGTVEPVAASLG